MEAERNLVRSYANKIQADQCAKGNDIAINITTFENFSSAITEVKAQDLYDAYIHSEADYAMFIFNNQVGKSQNMSLTSHSTHLKAMKNQNCIYISRNPIIIVLNIKRSDSCLKIHEIISANMKTFLI